MKCNLGSTSYSLGGVCVDCLNQVKVGPLMSSANHLYGNSYVNIDMRLFLISIWFSDSF